MEKIIDDLKLNEVPEFKQIRLETTNMCGYNCFCCPRSKMTRKQGIMPIEDLSLVLQKLDYIKYFCIFMLHGYGESLIVKDLPERVKMIKDMKPNFSTFIISTLGYDVEKLWGGGLYKLFNSGLDSMNVSLYAYTKEDYAILHGKDSFDIVKENLKTVAQLMKTFNFKLKIQLDDFGELAPKNCQKGHDKKQKDFIDFLYAIGFSEENIQYQKLHNFGSGFDDKTIHKKDVPCSICWGCRKEHLCLTWDLNVIPCSYDYNADFIWGNIKNQSLEDIFKSESRMKFIKNLLNFDLTHQKMCNGCFFNKNGNFDKEYEIIKEYTNKFKEKNEQ